MQPTLNITYEDGRPIEFRCSYCGRDVLDLHHPMGHDFGCPSPVPIRICEHDVQPCECSEGADE